jgi:glyoxylase-like metal-dependent hydrolase (beta-lactamase superfamily II)
MTLDHLRVFEVQAGIHAFYDGRIEGYRFQTGPNWVDDGALSLGVASYVLHAEGRAIVYDTHVSRPHGDFIRRWLQDRGITDITVVLSHWHLDHVAGTAAFADCPVIANIRTAAHLEARKAAIEDGTDHGLPAISPLILPDRTFDHRLVLDLGGERVELLTFNIHSDDATVLWLPERRVLLAGDTLEDCVTYVGAPEDLAIHLADLARLAALQPDHILPNHGSPEVIAEGGYGPALVTATADYTRALLERRAPPEMRQAIAPYLATGTLRYFAPYEAVHTQNLARVASSSVPKYPTGGAGGVKPPASDR